MMMMMIACDARQKRKNVLYRHPMSFGGASSSAAASSSVVVGDAPARRGATVPWVERYRPKDVGSISSQEDIVKSLKNAVASGNVR